MALNMVLVGMLLILLGFLMIFLAILLSFLRILKRSEKEEFKVEKHGGAVVMIGPLPIVLASDPKTAKVLIMLAIILTAILVVLTVISYGLTRLG
ncbi:MAG: DUF131 domain-containing protein [Thermoproteota archaeon]